MTLNKQFTFPVIYLNRDLVLGICNQSKKMCFYFMHSNSYCFARMISNCHFILLQSGKWPLDTSPYLHQFFHHSFSRRDLKTNTFWCTQVRGIKCICNVNGHVHHFNFQSITSSLKAKTTPHMHNLKLTNANWKMN